MKSVTQPKQLGSTSVWGTLLRAWKTPVHKTSVLPSWSLYSGGRILFFTIKSKNLSDVGKYYEEKIKEAKEEQCTRRGIAERSEGPSVRVSR